MRKDVTTYLALASCAYILVYVGVHMLDDGFGLALPMFATLAAFGTLLAGLPAAPYVCIAGGVLTGVQVAIPLAVHRGAPDMPYAVGCLAAAALAVVTGLILARRVKPADPAA